ncbi:MAG TPA: PAS domain-containing sensor histidine kinase [Tepidisphaeraceae bacterium]|nr:PAS domain-containing sensor histidine kinase [Tepidisphaeraceae bacterium]
MMDADPRIGPQRASQAVVQRQSQAIAALPLVRTLLDAVPCGLVVLNPYRQVVFANLSFAKLLGVSAVEEMYGKRPGELLGCEHAFECAGCGMAEACTTCGAAKAMAMCERGSAAVQECRIIQRCSGRALDLRITTTPLQLDGTSFTILGMTDISHEKRRQAMERLFFHDLLNTTGAIVGYADLLRISPPEEYESLATSIKRMGNSLADEIHAQRQLVAAENGDLAVQWHPVSSRGMLEDVLEMYRNHEGAQNRKLVLDPEAADVKFSSDRVLLLRVLGNLVKNALEAAEPGQTVTLGAKATDQTVEFWVHNPGVMPREVQLQVFHRSFSTKGVGRGLGTYSIKLLTERYLKGTASFKSSPEEGTVFTVRYSRSIRLL